jgi:Cu+-exporting ATPase
VDSIVFDKTGTLTTAGAAEVSDFRFSVFDFRSPEGRESLPAGSAAAGREGEVPGLSAAEAGWVRSLAGQSRHPHARRIAAWLAGRGPLAAVEGFAESPGGGIVGTVAGHELRLGARAWLEQAGAAVPELGPAAGSVVCLAIDGRFRGAFVLANALRPEADALLRELGPRYEVALLSGDNERERGRFQALLGGGAELHFYQSPVDKLDYVRRLQERGRTVLMIGDGLNDAGALKQSDVGVAVVENIGAFSPASDVILEAGELAQLRRVLRLAGRATQIVRLSFGISAAYNAVGVAIAGLGLLSPVLCAILMPASSVSVVLFACGATNWAARRIGLN